MHYRYDHARLAALVARLLGGVAIGSQTTCYMNIHVCVCVCVYIYVYINDDYTITNHNTNNTSTDCGGRRAGRREAGGRWARRPRENARKHVGGSRKLEAGTSSTSLSLSLSLSRSRSLTPPMAPSTCPTPKSLNTVDGMSEYE